MKIGKLLHHQGYTDIINTLPLINYHLKTYDKIDMLVRQEVKDMVDYYLNQFDGKATATYAPKWQVDGGPEKWSDIFEINDSDDILFTGCHDVHRTDEYKDTFLHRKERMSAWWGQGGFVEAFYTTYDIDYEEKINSFNLLRDLDVEAKLFKKFKDTHCNGDYILVHDDDIRNVRISNTPSNIKQFNLNQSTSTFFDFIQILTNAKEIHVIDSSWAAICYLLDGKLGLLKDIQVYVSCPRRYVDMFTKPLKLDNWTVKIC